QVQNEMRAGSRGSTTEVLAAADLLGRLQDASPIAAKALEGSDYAFLSTVQSYVEMGMNGSKAVALATEEVRNAGSPEWNERRERWSADQNKMEKQARKFLTAKAGDSSWVFGGS